MYSELTIREAARKDEPTLVEFNRCMARETEDKELDATVLAAGVRSVLDDPRLGFYMVAEMDGSVVGSLLVTTEWSDWRNGLFWWIQSVYVAHGFRRRGVYRQMYEAIRTRARNSPRVCGCRLYVERENAVAQATYAQLGMAETRYKMFEEMFS